MIKAVRHLAMLGVMVFVVSLLSVIGLSAPAQADVYTVPSGVTFNDPLGDTAAKKRINNRIVGAINHAPYWSTIRIASWNIRKRQVVRALVAAHKRGVSVKVLMAQGNHNKRDYNRDFVYLKREFSRYGNAKRRWARKSFARLCYGSCVTAGGIMHIKFFTFSQTGKSKNVVMHGSANLTEAAIFNQWNDLHTVIGAKPFNFFKSRFYQMQQDRHVANPLRRMNTGSWRFYFYPWKGEGAVGDPILRVLNGVKCLGAGPAGADGRTVIRIAQTVIAGERGKTISNRLSRLARQGCRIKIVFALMGREVRKQLANNGVGLRQLIRDRDGDGVYDDYMHLKAMTIGGNYEGNTNARVAWNGSHNWTAKSLGSDETFVRVQTPYAFRQYSRWVDKYMRARISGARMPTTAARMAVIPVEKPNAFSKIEIN